MQNIQVLEKIIFDFCLILFVDFIIVSKKIDMRKVNETLAVCVCAYSVYKYIGALTLLLL